MTRYLIYANQIKARKTTEGSIKIMLIDECNEVDLSDRLTYHESSEFCTSSKRYEEIVLGVACLIPVKKDYGWSDAEIEDFLAPTPEEYALSIGMGF